MESSQEGAGKPVAKKPYNKPTLEVYGDLRTITTHVGNTSPHADPPPHGAGRFRTH